ncbi:MAG: HAD family phosphatase [Verrucomicrobia bacterium]|nr:HAD family phosphatase [Verrucomicrobiota bacterium]
MHAPSAYCFDLDGTLIDSEVLWVEAIQTYLQEHGFTMPNAESQALVYGRSWRDIHHDITTRFPVLAMSVAAMEDAIIPYYARLSNARDIRMPSSIALLKRLAQTHPVCIVSGSSRRVVGEAVDMMGIRDCLRFYLGADDYAPGKPDPACYHLAATKLDLPPSACLVFEDSNAGTRAAKSAGMRCVVLARPERPPQDFSMADCVLPDLAAYADGAE